MAEKIWYQIAPTDETSAIAKLADLKELGISGILAPAEVSPDLKTAAEKVGLELKITSSELSSATAAINQHVIEDEISVDEMVTELNHANFDAEGLLILTPSADHQLAYQALAMAFLLPGQPVINAGLEGEKDSQDWQKVQALIDFRNANETLFQESGKRISVTENGLVKIVRSGNKKVTGYFNTSKDALGFNSVATIIQNYLVGQLLPKGVVIKQEAVTE